MKATWLALVTDAFGGRGGIAQYNRDFLSAVATIPRVTRIDVLPRLQTEPIGSLPTKLIQLPPRLGRFAYTIEAWKVAARLRPDVVFCGHLFMAPLAAVLAYRYRAQLVVQLHGVEIWQTPNWLRRRALEEADIVLCVSMDTRARALASTRIRPERVVILHNTVGEQFTPGDGVAIRAGLGIRDEMVLLSVGRLDASQRHKGQDRVIAALPKLVGYERDVIYFIAGDGDDRGRLEALAKDAGVAKRVRFLGYVPESDLPAIYRAADLFVLPSTGEGFGIAFLEAMACGTPALGLKIGGAVDALRDGELGVAVTPDEFEDALANAVTRPRPDKAALSAQVRARFGRDLFVARVHALFQRSAALQL